MTFTQTPLEVLESSKAVSWTSPAASSRRALEVPGRHESRRDAGGYPGAPTQRGKGGSPGHSDPDLLLSPGAAALSPPTRGHPPSLQL